VLTLSRVVLMRVQSLRSVGVVIRRSLRYLVQVLVSLGKRRTGNGSSRKRTGSIRAGRLTEGLIVLYLYKIIFPAS
jgi:hypothetical protein